MVKPKVILILIYFIIIIFCSGCDNKSGSALLKSSNDSFENYLPVFDLEIFFQNEPLDTILIEYDIVLKKKNKRYEGLYTQDLFGKIIQRYSIDTSNKEVLFICKDGYNVSVPLFQLLNEKGFVACKDIDSKGKWDEEIVDKFSPYYLVWDIEKNDSNHSFPYGVTHIKIINKAKEFADAYPLNASKKVDKGFQLFMKHCIKCHKLNKVGGTIGPELNTPKSIMEYWKTEDVKAFIKNPNNYRNNSKMPAMTQISDDDVNLIVKYLTHMVQYKKT
jgi:mono/diheme cytochrome c family protein